MSLFALASLALLLLLLMSHLTSMSSSTSQSVGTCLVRACRKSSSIQSLCLAFARDDSPSSPSSPPGGHSPSSSPTPHSSPRRSAVLFLDDNLSLLAIRECVDLLSLILSRSATLSPLHRVAAQCRVRLTYVLLRAPVPDLDRQQYLELQRHDQEHLAQTLERHSDLTSSALRTR